MCILAVYKCKLPDYTGLFAGGVRIQCNLAVYKCKPSRCSNTAAICNNFKLCGFLKWFYSIFTHLKRNYTQISPINRIINRLKLILWSKTRGNYWKSRKMFSKPKQDILKTSVVDISGGFMSFLPDNLLQILQEIMFW